MSMSDPFLPVPPETNADETALHELEDLEDDRQPDVDPAPEVADPDAASAAADAAEPGLFRTPVAGDRLDDAALETDLE